MIDLTLMPSVFWSILIAGGVILISERALEGRLALWAVLQFVAELIRRPLIQSTVLQCRPPGRPAPRPPPHGFAAVTAAPCWRAGFAGAVVPANSTFAMSRSSLIRRHSPPDLEP